MKILFEITHPHFVHFYKNLIKLLGNENLYVTCQESGIITHLLDSYSIKYEIIGTKYYGLFGKLIGQIKYFFKYINIIKKHRIDAFIGLSPSAMLAAKYKSIPGILFDDDDSAVQPLTKYFTVPFADYIITPECLRHENYGLKHYLYKGYQELAYLAPNYFTPDASILKKYDLEKESYVVLRFNEFKAHHDIGHGGISLETKRKLVEILSRKYKVLITTEGELNREFGLYQMLIDPKDIHHVLAYAFMFVGDSQTMASEAAVLGTPSVRCNTFKDKISYLLELEKIYGLTYAFHPKEETEFLAFINSLISQTTVTKAWEERKQKMLGEMEDINEKILFYLKKIEKDHK